MMAYREVVAELRKMLGFDIFPHNHFTLSAREGKVAACESVNSLRF